MRNHDKPNGLHGRLGSISGLVVFFEQEVPAEDGASPVVTRYALLITPDGQSVRTRKARRRNLDIEIKQAPAERRHRAPRRRRHVLH